MDQKFWLNRWKKADTGFHRETAQPFLRAYWQKLALDPAARVFVPLCGKSSDMVWLAHQGHHVVGAELSPIAIDAFFSNVDLVPDVTEHGALTLKSAGPYTIWQGDIFDISPQAIAPIDVIYDRAAVVALPGDIQNQYARFLGRCAPPGSKVFLISLSYDQQEMEGPPFSTPQTRVTQLFADEFTIEEIAHNPDALEDSENLKTRGLTHLTETLYILTRKPD